MVRRLSESIAQFFYVKNLIPEDEIDSYIYGYEVMLITVINWGTILLIMLFTGRIIETLLYMSYVIVLRHHVGGYHADTHVKCTVLSISAYIIFLLLLCYFSNKLAVTMSLALQVFSVIVIVLLAPVEHKNNRVGTAALFRHKKISIILSLVVFVLSIILLSLTKYHFALSLSLGAFQVGISLVLGVYKNQTEVVAELGEKQRKQNRADRIR